jgi:hypothetical protein
MHSVFMFANLLVLPIWGSALTSLLAPLGLGLYFALRAGLPERAWSAVRVAFRGSAPLAALGVISGLTGGLASALQFVDPRQALGVSVWLKPTKFGVSIAIASFTLAWLFPAIEISASRKRRAERAISAGLLLELAIINLQSARGVASHFNYTSALNSALVVTMGVAIVVVTFEIGVVGWHAFRTRYTNLALGAGIRSGFALVILGSLLAFLMTSPTAQQLASLRRGEPTPLIGGHSVGVNDASSRARGELTRTMPVTGWSDAGGDLRVPHFIGLHALQIMPLLGFWLSRRRRLSAQQAHALTRIAAWGYLGVIATTLVQALRARPLLAPDLLTCVLAASVAISCALAAASVWLRSREASAARAATWT